MDERVAVIGELAIGAFDPIGKRPAKVLVVDDDPDTCQLLSAVLSRHDLHVETAYDGTEGLGKAESIAPDLVILDIMMPEMDGFETCRQLKVLSSAPVLFLSAKKDVASVARALEIGGVDHMGKPFSNNDLASRVVNLLNNERAHSAGGARSELSTLESDPSHPAPELPAFARSKPLIPLRWYKAIKGSLDLVGGILGSLVTAMLLLPMAILIRLESGGPVIFTQVRVGKNGKPFRMHKFRTMSSSAPGYAQKGIDSIDGYVTPFGRLLRRMLIDEFPQFLNVLRGEMSLVGPRPELPNIVAKYASWERERLIVKPGITGWWQINGLKQPMSDYTHLDIDYVRHRSMRFDSHILWITLLKTIRSIIFIDTRNPS